MQELYQFCKDKINSKHWLGMMQTTLERIDQDWMLVHENAIKAIKETKELYNLSK